VWLDDTEWVPSDNLIVANGALPHGFYRPEPVGTQNEYRSFWILWNGEYLYPFDPFEKNIGRCTWVNSRHFAMVASTENRCRLLAELMHAYNVLANRKSVFSPEQGIMTLNGHTRIGEAPGENDEEGVRV
jgi:hypothetical protein